jgi:hypothetical protein
LTVIGMQSRQQFLMLLIWQVKKVSNKQRFLDGWRPAIGVSVPALSLR